jgi:hypothetical protein
MNCMNPLFNKDYEIDVLIGKLAAIFIVARSCFRLSRSVIVERESLLPFGVVYFVLFILIPCLYLFSLHKHNAKLARLSFKIWFLFFLFLCWSVTGNFLNKPSGFWKGVFPLAFITACMMTGVNGVARIIEPNRNVYGTVYESIKIPKTYYNIRILIGSTGVIFTFVFTFTLMVFIGKYLCDFTLIYWPSLEKSRALLFYIGMAISFYPSKILGAAVPVFSTVLFERIWNMCVKNGDDRT